MNTKPTMVWNSLSADLRVRCIFLFLNLWDKRWKAVLPNPLQVTREQTSEVQEIPVCSSQECKYKTHSMFHSRSDLFSKTIFDSVITIKMTYCTHFNRCGFSMFHNIFSAITLTLFNLWLTANHRCTADHVGWRNDRNTALALSSVCKSHLWTLSSQSGWVGPRQEVAALCEQHDLLGYLRAGSSKHLFGQFQLTLSGTSDPLGNKEAG